MYGINPDMQNSIAGASLLGAEVVRPDLYAQRSRPIHRMIRMISYHRQTADGTDPSQPLEGMQT